jgi:ankyrin repeat protein
MMACQRDDKETALLLVAHGASVDLADSKGRNALFYAGQNGFCEEIEELSRLYLDPGLK